MKRSSGLILAMASGSKSGERTEEDGAVCDEVRQRNGIGQHVGGAAAVWVVAVGGGTAGGAAAVRCNCSETGCSGASRRSSLEVCCELGSSSGSRGCGVCKPSTVGERGTDSAQLAASAAGANSSTFAECFGNGGSLSTINGHAELVGLVVESTSELSGSSLGEGKSTLGKDVEITTLVEGVESCSLDCDLLGLTRSKGDEVICLESSGQETNFYSLESNLVTCRSISWVILKLMK